MNRISQLACLVVSVLVLVLIGGVARASTNIIDATTGNGSLEGGTATGNFFSDDLYYFSANSTTQLPDWTIGPTTLFWYFDSAIAAGFTTHDGTAVVNFASGGESISQTFAITASDTYAVSFWERARDAVGTFAGNTSTVTGAVTFSGTYSGSTSATSSNVGTSTWTQYSFSFIPDNSGTATLTFSGNFVADGGNGVFLDSVGVTETAPVPEPASLSLLVVGGLLVLRRRR